MGCQIWLSHFFCLCLRMTRVIHKRMLVHEKDGVTVQVLMISPNLFVWIQSNGTTVSMKSYTKEEIEPIIRELTPFGNLTMQQHFNFLQYGKL